MDALIKPFVDDVFAETALPISFPPPVAMAWQEGKHSNCEGKHSTGEGKHSIDEGKHSTEEGKNSTNEGEHSTG